MRRVREHKKRRHGGLTIGNTGLDTSLPVLIAFWCLLLMLPLVSANSMILGSIDGVTEKTTPPASYTSFKPSFFSLGSERLVVRLSVKADPSLDVELSESSFELSSGIDDNPVSCDGCEWFILSDGRYVRTHPVTVYVGVPKTSYKSEYTIQLTATATLKNPGTSSGIRQNLGQARVINFKVRTQASGSNTKKPATNLTMRQQGIGFPSFNNGSLYSGISEGAQGFSGGGSSSPSAQGSNIPVHGSTAFKVASDNEKTKTGGRPQVPGGYITFGGKEAVDSFVSNNSHLLVFVFITLSVIIVLILRKK